MPFLDVPGAPIFYRRHPQHQTDDTAPPVVLIHGAGGNLAHWPPRLRRLPGRTVIAPDLPGHGQSEGAGAATISAYGDWLVAFLDAINVDSAHLVGHSMGGAIALDVAQRFPARVATLGLFATGATLPVAPALLEGLRTDAAGTIPRIARRSFSQQMAPAIAAQLTATLQAVEPALLYRDFLACAGFDARADLDQVVAPTLIVVGAEDRMTSPALSQALHARIRGSSLRILPGVGHMLMLEDEARVMGVLEEFLDGQPADLFESTR